MTLLLPEPSWRVARAAEALRHAMDGAALPCRGDVETPGVSSVDWEEEGPLERLAASFCSGCPVLLECREYALVAGERFGVWGGLTARERRAIRRRT